MLFRSFTEQNDIDYINKISDKIPSNSVVTIKCEEEDFDYLRSRFNPKFKNDLIPSNCNIIECRLILNINNNKNISIENNNNDLSIDHLDKFKQYIHSYLGNSSIIQEELNEVCK